MLMKILIKITPSCLALTLDSLNAAPIFNLISSSSYIYIEKHIFDILLICQRQSVNHHLQIVSKGPFTLVR